MSLETCIAENKPRRCTESAFFPLFFLLAHGGYSPTHLPGYTTVDGYVYCFFQILKKCIAHLHE